MCVRRSTGSGHDQVHVFFILNMTCFNPLRKPILPQLEKVKHLFHKNQLKMFSYNARKMKHGVL